MDLNGFQAANRFGLGAAPNEAQAIGKDAHGWLLQQLAQPVIPAEIKNLQEGSTAAAAVMAKIQRKKADKAEKAFKAIRKAYVQECHARFLAQKRSTQPFIERLVMFWSNHFTVSIQKPLIAGLVNSFEAEAIRPHVTGRFSDMLIAASSHPAMLLYLDNAKSFGNNSRGGMRRDKGLNENLGREILELHTLGVDGGYRQADVIALSNILTGWTLQRDGLTVVPQFAFQPRLHEPGAKVLLGKTYAEAGQGEGMQALRDLAARPATAQFIATKLARHFIADDPPRDAIAKLAEVFERMGGDLGAVSRALIELPQAWDQPLAKVKNPYEFVLSAMRVTGAEPTALELAASFETLNYRIFNAPSPAGYPDAASAWMSSDALAKRIEWAHAASRKLKSKQSPLDIAAATLGPVLREETRFTIAGAESAQDGLAFLLASPEFQRR